MTAINPKTAFELIYCSVRDSLARSIRRLAQIGERLAKALGQASAHLEQGISCAHQHTADSNWTHDESPYRYSHRCPIIARIGWKVMAQLWSHEKNKQRNEQSPGQYATGKLNRCQPQSDDVPHAEVGRAHAGCGERAGPASGHDIRGSSCA